MTDVSDAINKLGQYVPGSARDPTRHLSRDERRQLRKLAAKELTKRKVRAAKRKALGLPPEMDPLLNDVED